jgi:beta-lactamase class A
MRLISLPTPDLQARARALRTCVRNAAATLALVCSATQVPAQGLFGFPAPVANNWSQRLAAELALVDARHDAEIGVHVRDLDDQTALNYKADKPWYIASMVKVPVALAVLRGVEAGTFTLDTMLRLRAADYVDGAGSTNSHPVATPLSIRYLMEQMIIHSDNTASDMLIGLVGADEVNGVVKSLVPRGFGRITTLAEVRRQVYSQLTPAARHLTGAELIALKQQPSDRDRLSLLSHLVATPVSDFRRRSLDAAYTAYYASGVNSARLDSYADLLDQLVQGQALKPDSTRYLLRLMERVDTGHHRIRAGLAPGMRFAHKTGTQRKQVCDAGLLTRAVPGGDDKRVIVVACARGDLSLARSEAALQDIGNAICRSGLLTSGVTDAPSCQAAPRVERVPADPAGSVADRPDVPGR